MSHYVPQMNALGYNPDDNSTDTSTPEGVGNVAAQAVINFRHGDGANQTRDNNGTPMNPDDDFNTYPCISTPTAPCYTPTRALERPDGRPLARRPCACRSRRPDRPAAAERTAQRTEAAHPAVAQGHHVRCLAVAVQVTGPPKNPDGTCSSDATSPPPSTTPATSTTTRRS